MGENPPNLVTLFLTSTLKTLQNKKYFCVTYLNRLKTVFFSAEENCFTSLAPFDKFSLKEILLSCSPAA
jgi:hypothetical protein